MKSKDADARLLDEQEFGHHLHHFANTNHRLSSQCPEAREASPSTDTPFECIPLLETISEPPASRNIVVEPLSIHSASRSDIDAAHRCPDSYARIDPNPHCMAHHRAERKRPPIMISRH
jgi:hypothetical protein